MNQKAIELYFSNENNQRTLDILEAIIESTATADIIKRYGVTRQYISKLKLKYGVQHGCETEPSLEVESITIYGTSGDAKGMLFTAKPNTNGEYKLFPVGTNKLNVVKVKSLTEVLPYISKGYKIYVNSAVSSAQRSLTKCTITYK